MGKTIDENVACLKKDLEFENDEKTIDRMKN